MTGEIRELMVEHPVLRLPSDEELERLYREDAAGVLEFLQERKRRIALAETEPFYHQFGLWHWEYADLLLLLKLFTYVGGGNRSAKSRWATTRMMESALTYGNGKAWLFQDNEETSIFTQQSLVWELLPSSLKARNTPRAKVLEAISYTSKNGFSNGSLIFPNGSLLKFLTWNQKPDDFQGWELGAKVREYEFGKQDLVWVHRRTGERMVESELRARLESSAEEEERLRLGLRGRGDKMERVWGLAPKGWDDGYKDFLRRAWVDWRRIENIGCLADENMTMAWWVSIGFRLATRRAKMVWPYTPIDGVTLPIKDFRGPAELVESRESLLLKGTKFKALPEGHMPFVEQPPQEERGIIYFFCEWNPFGGYEYVRNLCAGKSLGFTRIRACGYAEEVGSRAWPKFGAAHICKVSELPEAGTNAELTDPAGARNWATIWVRVAPGNPSRFYIYRDWPDLRRHGEWAVPDGSQNPNPDGCAGPAQRPVVQGIAPYKRLFLEEEEIGRVGDEEERLRLRVRGEEKDPYRVRGVELMRRGGKGSKDYSVEMMEGGGMVVREKVFLNFIDPRAGRNATIAAEGGTCIIDEMQAEQRDRNGKVSGPRRIFIPAKGVHIDDGIQQVAELLEYNEEEPICPLLNEPRLMVAENCQQVIWTLSNYTAMGGERGGCKDFADLLRYLGQAREELRHVTGLQEARRGGSY